MNKEQFWSIVDDVRFSTDPRDQKQVCTELENRLRMLSSAEIVEWYEIYEFYREAAYLDVLWEAAAAMGTNCTDDGFMDFRSWLISQGKEVYLAAMQNPNSLTEVDTTGQNLNFETYPYAAIRAYVQRRTYEDSSPSQLIGQYADWAAKNEHEIRKKLQQKPLPNVDIRSALIDGFLHSVLWERYDFYAVLETHTPRAEARNELLSDIPARSDIVSEELYPYVDLNAPGCRYEDEHPGVFIGSDYVQYPSEQEQVIGMEMT